MRFGLPQNEDDTTRRERGSEIDTRRALYQLGGDGSIPIGVKKLPSVEELGAEKQLAMFQDLAGTTLMMGNAKLEDVARKLFGYKRTLDFYEQFYPEYLADIAKLPAVHSRYRRDDEFGRQRLAGVNPTKLRRCPELPGNFPVTESDVRGLLGQGATLAGEMAEGRIYICDYSALVGLTRGPSRMLAAPICLFHLDADQTLRPIAIQLGQSPAEGPVFTPSDPPMLWLSVKMFAQSADAAFHEVIAHLMRTHLSCETVYLCMQRHLSNRHPLYELLVPHFRKTMAINWAAKNTLIAPDGPIDKTMALGSAGSMELMAKEWKNWRFDERDLKTDLRLRGVDDAEALPNYPYRDDALRSWDIIEHWVERVVGVYYKQDADVVGDTEVQEWHQEMAASDGGMLRGLPGDGDPTSIAELVQFVTQVIFTVSAEHGAVNNGQFDYFGFAPNAPGYMTLALPTSKHEISEGTLADGLPSAETVADQIAMVHMLCLPTEHALGSYDESFFAGETEVLIALETLRSELNQLSKDIAERNSLLAVPYIYLDPKTMPESIAI